MGLSIRIILILLFLVLPNVSDPFMLQAITGFSSTGTSLGVATNVAGSPTGPGTSITLTWTKASGANNYDVKYGTSTGSYGTTVSNVGDVDTYDVTGLDACTKYFLVVVAKKDSTSSGNSNEVSLNDCPVYDAFTDADSTTLASHTGDQNASWTLYTLTDNGVLTIQTNRASNAAAKWGEYYDSGWTPPSADYSVQVDCVITGTWTGEYCMAIGRVSISANTYYTMDCGGGQCIIYSIVAGTPTAVGSPYSISWTSGQTHTIKLKMSGTSISGDIDGTTRCSGTDSAISAKGYAGFGVYGTHVKGDKFSVTVP